MPAAAEDKACGIDLMAGLDQRDPERYSRLRAVADAVPNGRGLLWKIGRQGVEPSWLFGTMHLSDERIVALPAPVAEAFEAAGTLVIETTGVLDGTEMLREIARNPGLTMLPAGETLNDHLGEEEKARLQAWLQEKGVPYQTVIRMRPWLILALASESLCEKERRRRGKKVLDVALAERAQASGKAIAGLESLGEQFEALNSFPVDVQMRVLLSTVELDDIGDDMMETLVGLYLRGETGMFTEALIQLVPHDQQDIEDSRRFEERVVRIRNRTMAERALRYLEEGNAFIAVGALHLPGEEGLVELLRRSGWQVDRVY